ncbi:MAG: hypothetical protein ACXAAQ_15805, partial [Candidatus Thorarchaeota archaeon]
FHFLYVFLLCKVTHCHFITAHEYTSIVRLSLVLLDYLKALSYEQFFIPRFGQSGIHSGPSEIIIVED